MRVLAISPEELWLDLEDVARETAVRELTMYKIGRQVEIADARRADGAVGDRPARVGGARARRDRRRARRPLPSTRGCAAPTTRSWSPPTPASTCWSRRPRPAALTQALTAAGAEPVSAEAAELVRIEHGPPALRRRHERREPARRGRHRRARRELHEGLLRRSGAGRAHVPQGPSQPPPARPAALGAGGARHRR